MKIDMLSKIGMLKNFFFIFLIIIIHSSCFPERRDKNLVLTNDFYKYRHYTMTEYINKEDELYIHINENIDHYYHVNSSKKHFLILKVINNNDQLIFYDTLIIGGHINMIFLKQAAITTLFHPVKRNI